MANGWALNGRTFPVHNPSTGEVIVNVPDMEIEDLREAIDGAYEAQKAWAAKTAKERSVILKRWYQMMIDNADDLANILTAEMGKPLAEAKGEIIYGASFIEWFLKRQSEYMKQYLDIRPIK